MGIKARSAMLAMGVVLAAAWVWLGWPADGASQPKSRPEATFEAAMAALAATSPGSPAEARAMERAIAAALRLAVPPAIPDAAVASAARARADGDSAGTKGDYLRAAEELGRAARAAPWVAEYQIGRGILLEKAEHDGEAATAFELYLKAKPNADDGASVLDLIAGLRQLKRKPAANADHKSLPREASSARLYRAGEVFRDCADCPDMVVVPAGRFVMGSQSGESGRFDTEGPQHPVSIRSFALGQYDVLEREFLVFLRATGYQPAPCDRVLGMVWRSPGGGLAAPPLGDSPRQPAVCLSWNDAKAYVAWLNGKLAPGASRVAASSGPYRLPSEAEWEYAARAGTSTARWWGEPIGAGNANCNGCGSFWDNRLIAESGSFGPNPFGLYDMLGNVWQWTADCWNETYVGAPADGGAWTEGDCHRRVIRGGSWSNIAVFVRSAARSKASVEGWDYSYDNYAGFRLARSLP